MKTSLLGICAAIALAAAAPAADWEEAFATPPPAARPWVYWFPLNGNLTKEGITADLEAMARVGIGGALYMETDQGAPAGAADFAGPLWMDLLGHATREAARLGLELNMHNDAGWCGSGGPWITPALSMQKVVWSETVLEAGKAAAVTLPQPAAAHGYYKDIAVLALPAPAVEARIPDIEGKASFKPRHFPPLPATMAAAPAGSTIPRDRIVDLTKDMDPSGKLAWAPPPGQWLVLRFGHTTTGQTNLPAPAPGRGLECDKFSKEAAAFHFDHLLGRLIRQSPGLAGAGRALVATHIDSWEVGSQNWTPKMRDEFRQRRGYDLLPFLPAFTGRIVDDAEATERFLWDLRQTVSDLLVENYAGTFRELAAANGIRLTIEAYDSVPADDMAYAGKADEPMGEFWSWDRFGAAYSCTEMTSAAHTYGKRIVGAEAFTANDSERWQGHPANVKDLGDWAFCEGINRFVFHRYAAQPWTNRAPGMSMGPWGLHYERTQTWWEQAKAWHEYLARCQYLLQQGLFVADIAYLAPEGSPRRFAPPPEAEAAPHVRGGYNFDGCSAEVVLTRMSVEDGRLVLPDGMSYRVLVLPEVETMTPSLVRKIKQLADGGAMVVGGGKPPVKSPSLADRGAGDDEVRQTAAALWASGKILSGQTAQQLLAGHGIPPDFSSAPLLRHIHRRIDQADVYFVANPHPRAVEAVGVFRVAGKRPELWWPDTGRREPAVAFEERGGVTRVPLRLDPSGSVFVVFRRPAGEIDPLVALKHDGKTLWSLLEKPRPAVEVSKATYGVPGDAQRTRDVTGKVRQRVADSQLTFDVRAMAVGDDPAYGVVKTLVVEFTAEGEACTVAGTDPESVTLAAPVPERPVAGLAADGDGTPLLLAWQAGRFAWRTAGGKERTLDVPPLPPAREIAGPWTIRFDPAAGGPGDVTFPQLEDWAQRAEDGIRFYSGTALYQTTFKFDNESSPAARWLLDLGRVEVMAEVTLNGKDLGIAWKPPYRIDVSHALQAGDNKLELKVVNLWINRQIGDEFLPEDSDRNPNGTLRSWPDWVGQGKPSPAGRFTFTSWRLWKKTDPLRPSGLLGPVRLCPVVAMPLR